MNEEAGEKYLLYIDILGFSKLVGEGRSKVEMIYGILNPMLNMGVHLPHGAYMQHHYLKASTYHTA